jgi:hypothetical protein
MEHGDGARHLSADGAFDVAKGFLVTGGGFGMGEFVGPTGEFADAIDAIEMPAPIVAHPFCDVFFVAHVAKRFLHFGRLVRDVYSEGAAHFACGSSVTIIPRRHGEDDPVEIGILAIAVLVSHLFQRGVQLHQQTHPPQEQLSQRLAVLGVVSLRFAVTALHFFF